MSSEHGAGLVRRYFDETLNRVNSPDREAALSVVSELLTSDFAMAYNSDELGGERGVDAHRRFIEDHATTFPDDHWTIETLVTDEEAVACIWHFVGRHAQTGNHIDVRAADFYRVRGGRLAELRRFLDFGDLRRQMRVGIPGRRPR